MKRFWLKRALMITVFSIAALTLFGAIVKALWNAILPDVIGAKPITFTQALGILVLSKILFGGFHSRGGWQRGRHNQWRNNLHEKLGGMTPGEKEKFRAEWRNRCGGRGWRTDRKDTSAAADE